MSDQLVSVRVPKRLANELRELVPQKNYMDFSEQLRSIVRQKSLHYLNAADKAQSKAPDKAGKEEREQLIKQLRKLLLEEVDE